MNMKKIVNHVVPKKETIKAIFSRRNAKAALIVAGGIGAGVAITGCKGTEQIQITPKKPVVEVRNDLDNYELKIGIPGGSKEANPLPLGVSINNNGQPNNDKTYYFVPSKADAEAVYGRKPVMKDAVPFEYRVSGIGLFENGEVNVGIAACKQVMEFLTSAKLVNASGGSMRLIVYNDRQLFVKEHSGYATQSHYILNRNEHGFAAIYENIKDTASFALWVIPEKMRTYSVKVPFRIVPEGDANIMLDSNFFAYSSGGRRQIQVAIDQETPVKTAAEVRDFEYVAKPTSSFGYSDGQNIVYTPVNAVYVGAEAMNYAIGQETFSKARGDTTIALGTVALAQCKVAKKLGEVGSAGLGVVITRTGALATYYRLIKGDATTKDTVPTPSVVTLPLTKAEPGLKVIENCNTYNGKEEVFNPVIGEGQNLLSFITNVPGQKDTMELRIFRETDGDLIKVKMGMAGVSRITHSQKGSDTYVTLWGGDGLTMVGQVLISDGVPYERIREKNAILEDGKNAKMGFAPMENKYNRMLNSPEYTQAQNKLRSRFAGRSI